MRRLERGGLQASTAVILLGLLAAPVQAQQRATLVGEMDLYADDTEFFNPFRLGETLFGTAFTVDVDVDLSDTVTIRGGVFGNHRFGSASAFEEEKPVLRVDLHGAHHRFILGTLDTARRREGIGPDLSGPHGLLPPLQQDTLAFDRRNEAGIQWLIESGTIRQDLWVNWQQLNTSEHREAFDAGLNGRFRLGPLPLSLLYQAHIVHHGGQLFDAGPVGDSWAVAPGVAFERETALLGRVLVEALAAFSRDVPDRGQLEERVDGRGAFVRLSAERDGWRGHAIVWRASDWLKSEGDLNYGALRTDGTLFEGTRRYEELGVARTFRPAEGFEIEASLRGHHVEDGLDYSARIFTRVGLAFPIWSR
jgi:hypothetical protein